MLVVLLFCPSVLLSFTFLICLGVAVWFEMDFSLVFNYLVFPTPDTK